MKAWGRTFRQLAATSTNVATPKIGARADLDWDLCVTSSKDAAQVREQYFRAFKADQAEHSRTPGSGDL